MIPGIDKKIIFALSYKIYLLALVIWIKYRLETKTFVVNSKLPASHRSKFDQFLICVVLTVSWVINFCETGSKYSSTE